MLYPRRCPICADIAMPKGNLACDICRERLTYVGEPYCMKCGKPIDSFEKEYCYDCTHKRHHYVRGRALFVYDDVMRKSIAGFKFHGKKEYARFYVDEMCRGLGEYIRYIAPDYILPIPIHKSKLRTRGFNQAELLARGLGKRLSIPVLPKLLIRNRKTAPQKELSDVERLRNLEKAFGLDKRALRSMAGVRRVMLVDDIYTTGSTIEACTKLLMAHGFNEIYFISVCIGKGY